MVSATGDWTANTLELEYPAVRSIYTLLGARDRVAAVRVQAEHNYNRESREAMYDWMAPLAAARERGRIARGDSGSRQMRWVTCCIPSPPLPPEALTAAQVIANRIAAATRQLGDHANRRPCSGARARSVAVARRRVACRRRHPPESQDGALSLTHPTSGSVARGRVHRADTWRSPRSMPTPRPAFIISKPTTGMRLPASASPTSSRRRRAYPVRRSWPLACGGRGRAGGGNRAPSPRDPRRRWFETTSDSDFLDRLYVPGIRRAGDLQTAMDMLHPRGHHPQRRRSIQRHRRPGDPEETDPRRNRARWSNAPPLLRSPPGPEDRRPGSLLLSASVRGLN